MLWNGKDLGTPLAIACRVAKGTASAAAGDKGPLEIRRAPGMPAGMGEAEVTNRSSSGWRFRARSTLETWPRNGSSPKLKRIAGPPKPAPAKKAELLNGAAYTQLTRCLRHQPDSVLSGWFRARVGNERGRIRRITIVALARSVLQTHRERSSI